MRLVRFDCQIVDMYEEEYFVGFIPQKEGVIVYKYFSELSTEQLEGSQEASADIHLERGNILGQSSPSVAPWVTNHSAIEVEICPDLIQTSAPRR